MEGGIWLITLLFGLAIYFVPAIIASSRNHAKAGPIFWVNLLTGWSVFGWVACIIWAFIDQKS